MFIDYIKTDKLQAESGAMVKKKLSREGKLLCIVQVLLRMTSLKKQTKHGWFVYRCRHRQ